MSTIKVTDIKAADGTSALTIADSTGNVGIGTNSPQYTTQITNTSANSVTDVLALHNESNANGTGTGARLLFKLSSFESAIETRKYASIEGVGTADYNEKIDLVFKTQDSATAGNPTERMRIDSSGHVIAPYGVTLGTAVGTYNADNTLDDYEEGTWTPTDGSGASLSFTETSGNCFYKKIGKLVIACARIKYPTTTDASNSQISGLPFQCQSFTSSTIGGFFNYQNFSVGAQLLVGPNSSYFFTYSGSSSRTTNADLSDKDLRVTLIYFSN